MAAFLTPREVAERWGCHPNHVGRLCASGQLRAMKLGRRGWRIIPEALAEYEARQTTAPEADDLKAARVARSISKALGVSTALDLGADVEYDPVFSGPVPWRSEVIDAASPAAGRGRSPKTKKAASQRH